jgi:predicted nuclease of predicted toxin-antitoxin system
MGFPPKIIWIRTGNLTTHSIFEILMMHKEQIFDFIKFGERGVLEILRQV